MKEDMYRVIRERILYLEYDPGMILNEKGLAQEFGVSRSPIKDVLSRLEWDQFLRVIPRTGSMVTEIEFSRAMNVYQVRFEMEAFEAQIAENQITQGHLDTLNRLVETCEQLMGNKNPRALAKVDEDLRAMIHDAAGNPVLADVSDKLYYQTFRLWFSVMTKGVWADEVSAVKTELQKILEYFHSGNSNELATIRRAQLVNHFERLSSKFLGT